MEILDSTKAFLMANDVVEDDLLNFTLEEGEEGFKGGDSDVSSSSSNPNKTATFSYENGSFPEIVEEDLEWLSNKDAFPAVETCFGILADNPELVSTHQSPISVLENTTSSSNSNTNSNVASFCASLQIPTNYPVRARSKRRGKKRRAILSDLPAQLDPTVKNDQKPSFLLPPLGNSGVSLGRRCLHCQADKTPQWRAGPMGPKTLCNACGVRYKSGRLLPEYRPANSPTFSSRLHSNSHRKVVEMRKEKQVATVSSVGE